MRLNMKYKSPIISAEGSTQPTIKLKMLDPVFSSRSISTPLSSSRSARLSSGIITV